MSFSRENAWGRVHMRYPGKAQFTSRAFKAASAAGDGSAAGELDEIWIRLVRRPCSLRTDVQLIATDKGQHPIARG